MTRLRWIGALGLMMGVAASAPGQFFPQPVYFPVPVYYPYVPQSGLGFYYQTGRFRIGGFLPITTPYTSINNNVTFSFQGPSTYVVSPRRLVAVEDFYYDVAGIDLDAKMLAKNPQPGVGIAGQVEDERPQVQPAPRVQPKAEPARAEVVAMQQKQQLPPLPPELPPPAKTTIEEYSRLIDLGRTAFQERMYGLAAMRFQQAVKLSPAQPHGYFMLSQAQFALGRYRDAAQTIGEGMRRHADWPGAAYQLRTDLFKGADENLNGFMKLLQDTATRNPNIGSYDFLLAHQLWFDGQRDAALAIFRRVQPMAAEPDLVDAFLKSGKQVAAQ